jgi:hypothetical protein
MYAGEPCIWKDVSSSPGSRPSSPGSGLVGPRLRQAAITKAVTSPREAASKDRYDFIFISLVYA